MKIVSTNIGRSNIDNNINQLTFCLTKIQNIMRKFFSLLAAVLFAGSMMAQVTITPSAITAAESTEISATIEGVSLNITQGTVTADQIRIFKNQTITISAESNITSIVFTCLAKGAAKYGPGCFTAQEGYTFEEDGFTGTWTGSATSVSFEASANQVRASQIVVTLEGGEVSDTYTVAGNDAAIFGESWNPALAANDMILANGVYTWTKANLNLTAGTEIQFKVVKNHSWDIAYPAQNYVVNIAEAGEYTLTITFDPTTEAVAAEAVKKVIPQYEVAEAIAAGLAENDEILVRGVITKMEFKGKNFAKFGSVNIYVADATGAEGAFEFYNCYSLNADTFRTSDPAYDAESTAWAEFDEVADENGNAIHVGDTVIAFGKYKLYNETHELNTGCYLTEIKHPEDAPVVDEWAEIVFTEAVAADDIAEDASFTVEGSEFAATITDPDNKMSIDANTARFGTVEAFKDYTHRLKTGGKSSSTKNFITLNIPEDGQLRIAVRTGSNSATDRNLVIAQGVDTLYNQVVKEEDKTEVPGEESSTNYYPYIIVDVNAGSVVLSYPTNGLNFYAFAFKADGEVPPTPEHTYTVAGSSDVAFGTTWAPTNTANDMALVEGLYTWEKSELTLAAGNILFKVCEDHAWTNCSPSDNYELNIPEAGIYTITITFNAETKEVAAVATKTGEAVVIPTVAMHGNFLGSWADTENFAIAQDNASASLTLTLAEGNYEFGMRIGGSGNWTANGANLTREANTTNLAEGSGNMHIAADVAGDYVFTYTYETQVLEVVYPEAPVVADTIVIDIESEVQYTDYVAQAGWWQFMAENDEYDISISNVSTTQAAGVYTVADLDAKYTYVFIKADSTEVHFVDGSFELTEGEDGSRTIEGVMIGDDGNIYDIKLVFRIPTAETTVNVEIPNWGVADAAEIYSYTGTLFYGEAADGTYIQFVVLGNNPIGTFTYDDMLPTATGIEVGGEYKAIYSMDVTVNASDAQRAIITMDILCLNNTLYHVTTHIGEGINAVEAAQKAVKMIQNGQVVIIKNGVHYNINGAVIR